MTAITPKQKRSRAERISLFFDASMLAALLANLSLLAVEILWGWPPAATAWQWAHTPSYQLWGQYIHAHFAWIDGAFVALFLGEFILQWVRAVLALRYKYWYAYPVLHWYDLLGCIPLAGFRLLRLLRVIGILLRLQRMGLIKLSEWQIVRFAQRLYDIVVEEVSDRVVIKVLSGVQLEIKSHGLMQRELLEQVIIPRRDKLARAVAERAGSAVLALYATHRSSLNALIGELVHSAVVKNRDLNRVEKIPMLGDFISGSIEHAIHDIAGNVVAEAVARLDNGGAEVLIKELLTGLLNSPALDAVPDDDLTRALIEVLELVKQRVARRDWLER